MKPKNWEEVKKDQIEKFEKKYPSLFSMAQREDIEVAIKSAIQSYENATKVEEDNHYGDEGLRSDRTFNAAIAIREEKIKEFWEEK